MMFFFNGISTALRKCVYWLEQVSDMANDLLIHVEIVINLYLLSFFLGEQA